MGKVLWGDIGNNGNVKKQGQLLFAPGGQGQGCAQQHRRDPAGKGGENFPPQRKNSASAWVKQIFRLDWPGIGKS